MPPTLATLIFAVGILGLFVLDRDRQSPSSRALWIVVIILLISARPVSQWLVVFGPGNSTQPAVSPDQFLDGSPLDRNVVSCLVVLCLIVLARRGRKVSTFCRRNAPILLFFVYCGLSVLWSEYTFVAFKRWIKGVGDLLLVLIVLSDAHPQAALKRVLARTSFILVPLSVLLIKYYPDVGRRYNPWTWAPEHVGVSSTKNGLGMICLVCGLASVWQIVSLYQARRGARRVQRLLAHSSVLAMILWMLWITDSKTSLCCFLIAGALLAITSFSRAARRPIALHVLAGSVLAISAITLLLDSGGWLISAVGRDSTLTGRTNIWKVVLSASDNPWVGSGFESFWTGGRLAVIWARTMDGLNQAHNGYLEVYLNLGWIGVALLGGLIVTGYRNVVSAFRSDEGDASLRLAFFVSALIYNLTEAGFREVALVWVAFLVAISLSPSGAIPAPARLSYSRHSGYRTGLGNRPSCEVSS